MAMHQKFACLLAVATALIAADSFPVRAAQEVGCPAVVDVLKGSAQVTAPRWGMHLEAGLKALGQHNFQLAEIRLDAARREARLAHSDEGQLKVKLALAKLYLDSGQLPNACAVLYRAERDTRAMFGERSSEHGRALTFLARLNALKERLQRAEILCRRSADILSATAASEHQLAECHRVWAIVMARQGFTAEAENLFKSAMSIFERLGESAKLDLADTLRDLALFYQDRGQSQKAAHAYERSFAIKESLAKLDQPALQLGAVNVLWDRGSPQAKIIDGEYPVQHLTFKGLRVAATIIDLRQLVAALISLKNTSNEQLEIGIGPVYFEGIGARPFRFARLSQDQLDYRLEEQTVFALTRKQSFLSEIQKTAVMPRPARGKELGYVTVCNIFGEYGNWDDALKGAPRPELLRTPASEVAPAARSKVRAAELSHLILDPGESRTGLVYFMYRPWQHGLLTIVVGNAYFQFPEQFRGKL